jgi:phosphate-selective porin OprO/OprP
MRSVVSIFLVMGVLQGAPAHSQSPALSLYYQEVERGDSIYVFNTPERYKAFLAGGDAGKCITLAKGGAGGKKLVAENETAIDLYLFKHGLPGYDRAAPKPAPAPFELSWKDGRTTFKTKAAELKLSNRFQVRFTAEDLDTKTTTGQPERESFRIRRAKTKLEGWVYSRNLEIELQLNWVDIVNVLDDANVNYDVTSGHRALMVKAGQFKVPFGRQQLTSAMSQQFVDRSAVSDIFARGRDIGVQLWGTPFKGLLDWRVGVFNGNGRTVARNDNDDLQLDARLTVQPFGDVKYSEGDFDSAGRFLFAVAGQVETNTREVPAVGGIPAGKVEQTTWGGDVVVKFAGVSLSGEYFERQNEPSAAAEFKDRGFDGQVGIFIVPKRLEVAARYSEYDPRLSKDGDVRTESGLALGYFWNQHNHKIQADYRKIEDEARGTEDRELRLQYVLFF